MLIYLQMIDSPEERSNFEKVYHAYRGLMYHVAFQILGHKQDAEDAVHSAFVSIVEHIEKFSTPVCPKSRSLSVIIVKNKSIDIKRKRTRIAQHEEKLTEDSIIVPQTDAALDVADCILLLPERYQEMILLKYRHGYSIKEIAELMDLTPAAASKLEQRAKKKLEEICRRENVL